MSSYEAKKGYNENSKNNSVKYYILSENSENNSAKKRYYNINNHSLYNKNIEILNGQRNINKLKDSNFCFIENTMLVIILCNINLNITLLPPFSL